MLALPVLTPSQAAEWDRSAVAAGVPPAQLMDAAGRAVAQAVVLRAATALRQGVLVACGPGNNGGDGWVAARLLHRRGVPVWVAALPSSVSPESVAAAAATFARADGVRTVSPDGPWPAVGCAVDAILGVGARGAPRGSAAALAERLADLRVPLVAVDGPTGLDLLDGVAHGPLRADLSVTFGGYRRGHLLARDEVGDVLVADIGFPRPDPAWPTLFTLPAAREALPGLAARSHKGTRGRVVVVGGDLGLTGAARLTARAAFGAGAGLVHVLAPSASVEALAGAEPDLQARAQAFDQPPAGEAAEVLARADAVVIGPGLNRGPSRPGFVLEVLGRVRAAVVDADALTALQGELPALARLAATRTLVLTPHAGEFRTLFPELASAAAVDPWGVAAEAAARSACVVLLKGVPTVVAGPEGRVTTVAAGNPGLATGGSGDTLSGLVATFLAQGVGAEAAAALGAMALGQAADLAAQQQSARALRPMDVIAALPALWRAWQEPDEGGDTGPVPFLHLLRRPVHS